MGRRLTLILISALIVGLAVPAYAEVQNIKVSGDLTLLGISRLNFDPDVQKPDADELHGATITRVRFDADLTENVSTVLRLLNERDWGEESQTSTEVDIDLASVTLKEFFYSPLTLTLGRQELHFGNDMIVGDPDRNNNASGTTLTDLDLSSRKAFNAVRATLDYDPLVIDAIWAKIDENNVLGGSDTAQEKDDIDLWGVNVAYDWGGNWNTVGELYYFGKFDNSVRTATSNANNEKTQINNIGTRVEISPTERLMLQGELAYQFGRNVEAGATANELAKNHQALAYQGIARYALDMKYDPVLTLIYAYYSGDHDATDDNSRGWDPMYENQTLGHVANVLMDPSNLHVINLRSSFVPVEDLTITTDYVWYSFVDGYGDDSSGLPIFDPGHTASSVLTTTGDTDFVGHELDFTLAYDYTEDVQLGLLAGWFFPGDAIDSGIQEVVSEVIASVKVSF